MMKDFYVMLHDVTAKQMFELVGDDWLNLDGIECLFITNRDSALFSWVNGAYHFQHFGWSSEYDLNGWLKLSAEQALAVKDVCL